MSSSDFRYEKEPVLTLPLGTTYEVIVPSQPPTGILSIKLHGTGRLTIPEPCEGSRYELVVVWNNPWLPYAIMEYEQFQISTESMHCYNGRVGWAGPREGYSGSDGRYKFEVSTTSSKLVMRMFARRSDAEAGLQIVSLGFITVNPFMENGTRSRNGCERIPVQDGTGSVTIDISYVEKKVPPLHDTDVWCVRGEMDSSDLVYVEKQDTDRSYGMKTVPTVVDVAPTSELAHRVEHPFIAPLKFAFKSPKGLSLLSPLASGGPLSHHLQRARRFDVGRARFYAAELLCALEYLHDKHIIVAHLNMEDVFLDSPGHLSLCNPSLFSLEAKDSSDKIVPGTSAYPAPELVSNNQVASQTADWWAFGILLYEMLTGLPPFYDKDTGKRRLKICRDAVCPEGLPPTAKDILIKLLEKNPLNRLGVKNGASEIKDHPFFQDTNWHDLLQRKYTTPFKPHDAATDFWPGANEYDSDRGRKVEEKIENGKVYQRVVGASWPRCEWNQTGWVSDGSAEDDSDGPSSPTREEDCDDGWELLWDPTSYRFNFRNRFTDETSPGRLPEEYSRKCLWRIPQDLPAVPPAASDPACRSPPLGERKAALATALVNGYGVRVFSQILGHGNDLSLNILILRYEQLHRPMEGIINSRDSFHEVQLTPLEWAVEHDRLDLVDLFLAHGADANYTIEPVEGPALVKAVRRGSQKLIEALVRKTNRVSGTRALLLAVKTQRSAIVNTLLANGVQGDFDESDRPLPKRRLLSDYDNTPDQPAPLQAEHFTPPLLLAARSGNVALVKALLAHGADPNAPYHGVRGLRRERDGSGLKVAASFTCGRVIQSAMEYGNSEIVELLLDAGADIGLPHPVWPVPVWPVGGHICEPVPRAVYLEVTAGLEAARAEREREREKGPR